MKLLTQETLTRDEFVLLRDAPLYVVLAISGSGGSRLDSLFERAAGAKAILNGKNNDHPLVRAIAVPSEIDAAMSVVDARVRDARGALAPPSTLQQLAVDAVRQAVSVLNRQGGELDMFGYREFIRSVAKRVAEAAREHDILGLGGQLVSDGEREVITAIEKELT
jgi:hypothetical protein